MNKKLLIYFISLISIVLSRRLLTIPQKYNILLALAHLKIVPSNSLCRQIGMQKHQNTCSQPQTQFLKLRHNNQRVSFSQKQLCSFLQLSYCGETCCLGSCKNNSIAINDNFDVSGKDQICEKIQPSTEVRCKQSGLLWCDGECCGFSAEYHKCYRVAHYGIPYVRCPIESSDS